MIKIAIDAMGGDSAPEVVVKGAVQAVREADGRFGIILTGPEEVVRAELDRCGYRDSLIEVFHAPQMVGMDEPPSSVLKTKPESGLVSCVALQKKGLAQASISAGNSGAMMAACLMILGRAGNISRPGIACAVPTQKRQTVLIDCGANVDEKAITLVHFAICGSIYAEHVLGYANPRVGLLNIGEEEKKGPEVIQETYQLLKRSQLNFIGNIEGRDLVRGEADVVVAPGYAGNIVLKLMEGFHELHEAFFGEIDTPNGRRFSREWDYASVGGGLLLGINGTGIITHGRASDQVIRQAAHTACQIATARVAEVIVQKVGEFPA